MSAEPLETPRSCSECGRDLVEPKFQRVCRECIEGMSREEIQAYIGRQMDLIRAANAACLRECLTLCPDREDRCDYCVQNAIVSKVRDGVVTWNDGSAQRFAGGSDD